MFCLRVRAIFFAMITLAVASAFAVLVSQLSGLTGGEDGLNYRIPRVLTPAFRLIDGKLFGVSVNGRVLCYYFVFVVSLVLFPRDDGGGARRASRPRSRPRAPEASCPPPRR